MSFVRIAALAASGLGIVLAAPGLATTASPASASLRSAAPAMEAWSSSGARPRPVWTWPLAVPAGARRPAIVRAFQPPTKRWESGHRGVDLLAAAGESVVAAGSGTVSFAGPLFGRPVIAIDHTVLGRDTLRTTYEPVDASVKVGQKVRGGEVVGHIAADAVMPGIGHCPPRVCLHWGVVRGYGHDERYLDPAALLGRGSVRLLPVWRR